MTTLAPPPAPTIQDGRHRAAPPAARSRLRALFTGPPEDPRWARPALWAILVLATALYAWNCLLYTSPSPRDGLLSRMPSSA